MFYAIIKNEVKKMIDQEQAARTLINLIDVVHQENWVLLNNDRTGGLGNIHTGDFSFQSSRNGRASQSSH